MKVWKVLNNNTGHYTESTSSITIQREVINSVGGVAITDIICSTAIKEIPNMIDNHGMCIGDLIITCKETAEPSIEKKAPEMKYHLDGDLRQMGIQESYLRQFNIKLDSWDIHRYFVSEYDYKLSLRIFWNNSVDGWWNYKDELIKYDVCTLDQYNDKLRKSATKE